MGTLAVAFGVVSFGPIVVGMEPAVAAQSLSPAEIEAEVREADAYPAGLVAAIGDARHAVRHLVIETLEPVAKVILDTARREQIDTIVLGTHGKSGVSRLVLGSVSEEVLERSPNPVLLVHQQAAARAEIGGTRSPGCEKADPESVFRPTQRVRA